MHFNGLLNKVFAPPFIGLDKRVHRTLLEAVKYVIKRMDRLFGNTRLHHKREQYYRVMTKLLVGTQARPVIIVD